jgi:C4-type Zn-finger protein
MSFTLYVDDTCPKCRKPTMQAVVELHPTNPELALQNFECADCGPVKTKIISLKPREPAPELAAQSP